MVDETPFWEDLLEFIEERRVIPVIGAELLRVPADGGAGGEISLNLMLARRLAARLGVPADGLPEDAALNAVICRHLSRGGRREDVYPRLRAVASQSPLPTPEPLRKLARIRHFDLFVTTTFDSLLEQAIDEVRFAGAPAGEGARSIAYAPNNVKDLPCPVRDLDRPTVFHLLGRLSAAPEYALTEEDVLEFLYALQTDKKRPELLFDELKTHHLLLIGNHFPDWLARFFIRMAKGGRLSGQRDSSEILADRSTRGDEGLVLFLKNFSYHTQVYAEGGADEFVAELAERYLRRHPPQPAPAVPTSPAAHGTGDGEAGAAGGLRDASPGDGPPEGAVFLSYASADREAVGRVHDALNAVGVDVWFDRRQLDAGDEYSSKIRRGIKTCSLFVPVISAHTQARLEGYFRLEWRLAAERAMQIADTVPFIVPVCLDETPEADAIAPDKFLEMHWARLPGGEVTPAFAQRIVGLVRELRRRQRA